MSAHIPPTIRRFLSPSAAVDLENWVRDVVRDEAQTAAGNAVQSEWMTVKQAAEWLGCDVRRIYDKCDQRRLTRYKDGGRLLLRRSEVEAQVEKDAGHDW